MKLRNVLWAAFGGVLGGSAVWIGQTGSFSISPGDWSYEELAATLLTGASLLVTIIGAGVAVLALWGYSQFKSVATEAAQRAATEKIEVELREGELRAHVENVVRSILQEVLVDKPGPLLQYLEQRAEEQRNLRQVDENWRDADEGEG